MPSFGHRSLYHLNRADPKFRQVADLVIPYFDFAVTDSDRNEELQNRYYDEGLTKVEWPDSRHNTFPSKAVHFDPYPINYNDIKRYYYLAGWMMMAASTLGIRLRWGGDWDRDTEITDQTFNDLAHYEILE